MSNRWEEVADAAAKLFLARGYEAVGLREIADALSIKAASLYYHCEGGKPELYARSIQHFLQSYGVSLERAAEGVSLERALSQMAEQMLSAAPVDLYRIVHTDLPELGDQALEREVSQALHDSIMKPFMEVFARGVQQGSIRCDVSLDVLAGAAVALVGGLGWMHIQAAASRQQIEESLSLVRQAFDVLLSGARRVA